MTVITNAFSQLDTLLDRRFSISEQDRARHAISEHMLGEHLPDAVVWPRSTAEVAAISCIAHEAGLKLIPFGASTCLQGQTAAMTGGIAVNFANMDRVLRVRPEDMDVTVQPGVTCEALAYLLRDSGLFFPVDPGGNPTIGGMAAMRAIGTTSHLYGSMRENVRALEVVLADGRVVRTGSRAAIAKSGYDLTSLFVGSEGTLGMITELTLRLQNQPETRSHARCGFARVEDAVRTAVEVVQAGIRPARMELIDTATVRALNTYADAELPEMTHLLMELHGGAVSVADSAREVAEIVQDNDGMPLRWSMQADESEALWAMRHNALYAIKTTHPGRVAMVTDVAVPLSRLSDMILETEADLRAATLPAPLLGHLADGNFQVVMLVDGKRKSDREEAERLTERMVQRALSMGGAAHSEHGIGSANRHFMAAEHGIGWELMGAIKSALDPRSILNPGKLVP